MRKAVRDKVKEADGYAVWKPILRAVRELSWGRFTEPDARAQFVFIYENHASILQRVLNLQDTRHGAAE